MSRPDDYGPATQWLAERAGVPPKEVVAEPVKLLRALAVGAREAAELAARGEADDLRAKLTGGDSPGRRFGTTVAAALRREAERLSTTSRQAP